MELIFKAAVPLKICFLTGSKSDLTRHHIIPQREFPFHSPNNLMVLSEKIHKVIDCPKEKRTRWFYLKYEKEINKYNSYLKYRGFHKKYLWRITKVKKKFIPLSKTIHPKRKISKQHLEYLRKRELLKKHKVITPARKKGLTPFQKRLKNEKEQNEERNS